MFYVLCSTRYCRLIKFIFEEGSNESHKNEINKIQNQIEFKTYEIIY